MSKTLPPFSRRYMPWHFNWDLDWGTRIHRHHHSTRKRLGAMKPIRKFKTMPRGTKGTLAVRLKRKLRSFLGRSRRGLGSRYLDYLQRLNKPFS